MKITEVRVYLTGSARNYVLVKILTDEPEIYGVGDGTVNGSEPVIAAALEHLAPLIIGRDPSAIEDIWQTLYSATYWRGGIVYLAALAAIDLALWDIKGKVAGLPVYQLLGGACRDGVGVYGHAHGSTIESVEESARRLIEQGYKYVRVQLDGGYGGYGGPGMVRHTASAVEGHRGVDYFAPEPYLSSTPRLVEHLRSRLGQEINLLHDVHEQLLPIEAARLAKDLEPYRLFYLEDALRPEHIEGFDLIRRNSTTALAMGEIITGRAEWLPLFRRQLIDFIRIAPIHVGGITEARKICVMAEPYAIRSAFHGAMDISPIGQAAAVHLDKAIPNFGVQEWMDFPKQVREVITGGCEVRDGYTNPPEKPGLGVDINEEAARKYPYKKAYMPTVRRVDGTMHVY